MAELRRAEASCLSLGRVDLSIYVSAGSGTVPRGPGTDSIKRAFPFGTTSADRTVAASCLPTSAAYNTGLLAVDRADRRVDVAAIVFLGTGIL